MDFGVLARKVPRTLAVMLAVMLHERVGVMRWLGAFVVCIGVAMIAASMR